MMKILIAAAVLLALGGKALAYQHCDQICTDTRDGRQMCHFECYQY